MYQKVYKIWTKDGVVYSSDKVFANFMNKKESIWHKIWLFLFW
jgi:hypothetical protein